MDYSNELLHGPGILMEMPAPQTLEAEIPPVTDLNIDMVEGSLDSVRVDAEPELYILLCAFCFGLGIGVINGLVYVTKLFITSEAALHWLNVLLHFAGIFFLITVIYILMARLVRRHRPNFLKDIRTWLDEPLFKRKSPLV